MTNNEAELTSEVDWTTKLPFLCHWNIQLTFISYTQSMTFCKLSAAFTMFSLCMPPPPKSGAHNVLTAVCLSVPYLTLSREWKGVASSNLAARKPMTRRPVTTIRVQEVKQLQFWRRTACVFYRDDGWLFESPLAGGGGIFVAAHYRPRLWNHDHIAL